MIKSGYFFLIGILLYGAMSLYAQENNKSEYGRELELKAPFATSSASKVSKVIGWPSDRTPIAPDGYRVVKFADGLSNPRWVYVADNGDVFVSQARTRQGNNILLFRDTNGDGVADTQTVFLADLNMPFGMLVLGDSFYVATTDAVWQYPYRAGEDKITAKGKKILDLPAGGYNNHWTRNLFAGKDGQKIFVTVGSGSNVGENGMEHEVDRADILEINPDGSGKRVYAAGLRNPVGLDYEPESNMLWTAVNERDGLGDELVPDYITSVQEGFFYGWPYAYWGKNPEPRRKGERDDLVAKSVKPDFALGAHTASLGLAFSRSAAFPKGAYIGQHGSWNRSQFAGYKVAFVPFQRGKPSGEVQDFLSGFIADEGKNEVYGRPVGVTFAKEGYMLVVDDAGNTIWAVLPD
ncbi:PQQ-dependent sugar dehydrogenase [Olivibacter sitiensis]|uniref:PQQ-dependent sugar dehydrogenase n=1 Tax=Olivibacter sitiensis TaxID=376470 RepID=UPI0004210AA7|nr:sorbosone dehydrogenase family protein [Olivibacter sitiensis]